VFRASVAVHVLGLAFELGVVASTLVNMFSDGPGTAPAPGVAGIGDGANSASRSLSSNLGFELASLSTTFVTFAVNLVGARKLLSAVRAAASRASTVFRTRSSRVQSLPLDMTKAQSASSFGPLHEGDKGDARAHEGDEGDALAHDEFPEHSTCMERPDDNASHCIAQETL
jgi:hypothetical protein